MNELLKTLLTISLTASVMILVVLGVRAMLAKRMNPAVIAALWAVVLIRLCVPITLESPVHVGDLIPEAPVVSEQTVEAEVPTVNVPQTDAVVNYNDTPTMVNNTILPQTEVAAQPKVVDMTEPTVWQRMADIAESISLWSVLAAVWILGAVVVLGNTLRQGVKFNRRLKKCKRVTDGEIRYIVNELRSQLGIRQHVHVVVCNEIWAPAVFGCFHPVIILPIAFVQNVDKQTIRCILLHEMCHIKRRDILKSYVWLIAKAMHWFNPLVWLAFRKAKDDIELCCDQMVIRHLDENSKFEYTQSLVDVFRISKRNAAYPVTVSLFENKAKLIERVMRMLKPNKRSKTALALTILLTLLMTVTCFTTACQPVAKAKKAVSVLEEPSEQKEELMQSDALVEKEEVQSAIAYPAKWQKDILNDRGEEFIHINSKIIVPDVSSFPVRSVSYGRYSQKQVDELVGYFSQGKPLIAADDTLTKAQIKKMIKTFESELEIAKAGKEDLPSPEEIQDVIDKLTAQLADAPEKLEETVVDSTLQYNAELKQEQLDVTVDLGKEKPASISVQNSYNEIYLWTNFCFDNFNSHNLYEPILTSAKQNETLKMTREQAAEQAQILLDTLGLHDMVIESVQLGRWIDDFNQQGYIVTCNQSAGGIPILHSALVGSDARFLYQESKEIESIEPEDIVDIPVLQVCRLQIQFDDSGLISFRWLHRLESGEVQSEEDLLSFNEIQRIFEQEMKAIFSDENIDKEFTFNVNNIRLVYSIVPDDVGFMLVPSWHFYGDIIDPNLPEDIYEQPYLSTIVLGRNVPIITINAIDGSVI